MINPMNTKQLVDLHTRDLERLVEPRGWQEARRRASASLRRRRMDRGARAR
jgi:predicted RNA binding protein YcfA (HicA-like mRNA interferase family)